MKFTIANGTNICSIGMSDIGSYIKFNYPLTVVWHDCRGSVGKYFCVLPYNEEYRKTVQNEIVENLYQDFTENIEGLFEILKPLFPLFKNGEYSLCFYSNKEKEFFQYQTSSDNFSNIHFNELEVVFAQNTTDLSKVEIVQSQHKSFLNENEITKKHYSSDILEYSTDGIYTGWQSFFATQPIENIDQNRVKHFEEKINNGESPFAILFNAYLTSEDFDSSYFILDGHHKLLAYQNLGLFPPIAIITYLPNSIDDIEFDAEILSEVLYPWQVEHILKNWDGKDEYLERTLKNPKSNLHSIIKNGDYEEYHENGVLKHKAFYINDKVDGSSKYWYKNGRLKSEHYYNKGLRMGTWKSYYESGKTEFIQPFNEVGNYNGILVSYFENGQKKMEQVLENGRNEDGVSYKVWFENGDKDSELTYRNGLMIVRKNWNSWGEFVNHEVYNEKTKKLEKLDIPLNEKYVLESKNYKQRQAEIKEITTSMRNRKETSMTNSESGLWNKIKRLFK
jgi:antitoxin component YwqK of YwqJK toxin-antitoxin module